MCCRNAAESIHTCMKLSEALHQLQLLLKICLLSCSYGFEPLLVEPLHLNIYVQHSIRYFGTSGYKVIYFTNPAFLQQFVFALVRSQLGLASSNNAKYRVRKAKKLICMHSFSDYSMSSIFTVSFN